MKRARSKRGEGPFARDIHRVVLDLVDHLDAMVAYWDINQVCRFANQAYRTWFGKGRPELVGTTLKELLGPALYEKNLPYITAAYAGQKQIFERDIPIPDGSIRSSLATYTPHVVDGQVQGIFVHVADVTPLKVLERELRDAKEQAERLATHDFLTGLPNRVLLLDNIREAMTIADRKHQELAVLTIDVDNFKAFNDTYGHAGGDRLLVELASRLTRSLHGHDMVARIAGDEFVLVALDVGSAAQVETTANRILDAARQPFAIGHSTVSATLSIGVAIYPRHGATPEALLVSSDRAMYVAKRHGKDRFAVAD